MQAILAAFIKKNMSAWIVTIILIISALAGIPCTYERGNYESKQYTDN